MSTIPSFITDLTNSIYGESCVDTNLVNQFASQLGVAPDAIPDTTLTEEAFITFLSNRVPILQFMSTFATQVLGSTANIDSEIKSFRASLGLRDTDPLPDTDATQTAFANFLMDSAGSSSTLQYISQMTAAVYGTSAAATNLLDGFRASLGLNADQTIPNSLATQASFLSYLATQSTTFAFISQFTQDVTGSPITAAQLQSFASYLGLRPGQAIPSDYATSTAYIDFVGETNSFAIYAASAVTNTYGISLVSNVSLLSEFIASSGLTPSAGIQSNNATKHAFLYFLTSPTTLAAQAIYGISQAAATSLAAFRTSQGLSSIPTDSQTLQDYFSYLGTTSSEPAKALIQFMEATTQTISGSPMTNATLTQFRAFLGLSQSATLSFNIPADLQATESQFMSFLQQNLAAVGQSEAVNAISPYTQQVQAVLYATFSVALKMLNALEQSTRVESQALEIYAEWEEQYTNLLTSTPIYGPTDQNQIEANSTNFGSTTLGADNVTVLNVANWLLSQIQTTGQTSARFTIQNPTFNNTVAGASGTASAAGAGFPSFLMTKNSDGTYTFSIQAQDVNSSGTASDTYTTLLSTTNTPSSTLIGQEQSSALINNMMSVLTTNWNNNTFASSSFNVYAYPYSRDGSGKLNTGTAQYLTFDTSYLKTLWSAQYAGASVLNFSDGSTTNCDINGTPVDFWNSLGSNYTSLGTLSSSSVVPVAQMIGQALPAANAGGSVTVGNWTYTNAAGGRIGTFTSGSLNGCSLNFCVEQQSSGSYAFEIYINNASGVFQGEVAGGTNIPASTVAIGTGMWGPWNGPGAGAWPETVAYPSGYSSLANVQSQANSYVGEVNAQLQQYVQSTQAKKTNLDNSMSVLQNLITQTTQATSNQSSLCDSIVESFKSIITSIFTG